MNLPMQKQGQRPLTLAAKPVRKPDTVVETSPARRALREAQDAFAEAERLHRIAYAPIPRLRTEVEAAAPLLAELERLESADVDAMADWAKTGEDAAPEPHAVERRAAMAALAEAEMTAKAAQAALKNAEQAAAESATRLTAARERIKPAVAQVLREDGARRVAEYWRRYADLEFVGRELTALDQVLAAEFPTTHAGTGRQMLDWIAPDKLSAPQAMHAIEGACAGLANVADFARDWRIKAAELAGG